MSKSTTDVALTETTSKRKLPIGWFVVTGVLLVLFLTVWIRGSILGHYERAGHREALKAASHAATIQKGLTMARAFRNVDSALLGTNGQTKASPLFAELVKDPEVVSVVLYGGDGAVKASSNLKFSSQRANAALTAATEATSLDAADGITATGPIFGDNGERIGSVVITLTEKPAE